VSDGEILVRNDGPVRILTIDRPAKHNAITEQMREQLTDEIDRASSASDVSAVVLTGGGERAFCVGADLSEVAGRTLQSDWRRNGGSSRQLLGLAIENCRVPTIAAARGFVIGLGLEIALACDIRIAAVDSKFAFPELKHGIVPGSGGTQRLPRIVGQSWASDMILSGRQVNADDALRIGLVTRVTDANSVVSDAISLGTAIGEHELEVVWAAKRAVQFATRRSMYEDLAMETMLSTLCLGVRRALPNSGSE